MLQIISNYLGISILWIGEILFAKIVLGKKIAVNKISLIVTFVVTIIIYNIIYMYFTGTFKTFMMFAIHFLEFKFLFKLNYLKAIFLTFIYIFWLVIPDVLLIVLANFEEINKIIYSDNFINSLILNLASCILILIIGFILKKPLRKIINAEISNNIKIVFLSVATLLCVVSFLFTFADKFRINGNSLPYLISMCVLMIILFSLIKKMIENNKLVSEYDQLLEFMTTYENEIEKQRILRHETKNEFLAIKAKLCDKQNIQEIVAYIDEILKDKIIVNQEKYAKFGYLPPNGIKGLCYFKMQEAEKLGINISINVSSKIRQSNVYNLNIKNQRDLGKLLGVFLDNAIEASVNSEKKQLGIEIYTNRENEFTMIVSNTFDNEINKNKLGNEKFSTKGKERGHGLLLVKHIIGKNKIFETKTEIINDVYVQIITIKKTLDI